MPFTKDWTEVNNGIELQGGSRNLAIADWPEDMEVDIAVNGKILKTYNYTEFKPMSKSLLQVILIRLQIGAGIIISHLKSIDSC